MNTLISSQSGSLSLTVLEDENLKIQPSPSLRPFVRQNKKKRKVTKSHPVLKSNLNIYLSLSLSANPVYKLPWEQDLEFI